MHLNPYGEYAVTLAADLANRNPETLAELVERCVDAGIILDFPIAEKDLDETLDLLIEWSKIVDVTEEAARAELVNVMLEQASAYPRMTNHANDGWHLHYRDPQQSLAEVLKALFSVGTALHLVGRGMHRLGRAPWTSAPTSMRTPHATAISGTAPHVCESRRGATPPRAQVSRTDYDVGPTTSKSEPPW